jgi:hypothetical protein
MRGRHTTPPTRWISTRDSPGTARSTAGGHRVQPLDVTPALEALGVAVPSVRRDVERHQDRADLDGLLRRLAARAA